MSSKRTRSGSPGRRRGAAGRTLLVLFFCAGIAFLGLLGGGDYPTATARHGADPMAGYYPSRGQMPRYPGTRELPAGPNSHVGGARVRMSFFTTEDPPARVARFYANHWRQRRLFVTEDVTHKGGVVSAVDMGEGLIYQSLIVTRGERTMVFPSLTRTPMRAAITGGQAPVVPLFPGSRAVVDLGSTGGQGASRITLSVNDGTLAENVAHYGQQLRGAGYQREVRKQPKQLGASARVLLFTKDRSEVTVNLTALAEKRTRVHLMEVGSGE